MKHPKRITVLLSDAEVARFAAYCREHGHKKATLVARLIREFLRLFVISCGTQQSQ
ncbi:MAG: hypothetical protein ACK40S_08225 [Burkholderiaceae bacterium]